MSTDTVIRRPDGRELAATVWSAESDQCVIINSAMGVKRGFYARFADYLCDAGFHVITYDYAGIGDSAPDDLRSCDTRLYEWGEQDFEGVLRFATSELQALRIAVVGHSVGSQVIGLAESNSRINAIIMVASQSGYWGHWSGLPRVGMFFVWHAVLPVISRVLGHFPGRLAGGNVSLPEHVARDWARCGRDPAYLRGSYARESDNFFQQVRAPILALNISDDHYAPRASTEALLSWYIGSEKELIVVTPESLGVKKIKHFGWFREHIAASSWKTATTWLTTQLN
ncbi:MAG: alpha/beta fold hydrolase [Gammaproteobacteria bacterium]|nr:alpha/beta fold hydrolase [Gammaproteobacteria bacterium]MDH3768762.1 alpha/beta fold hydrolase [Gammaproteobacteria bacterium]